MTETTDDYCGILLSGAPLLDVRAPIEFKKGAFPGAVNLPLLNDIERQKVGYCYKHQGSDEAVALGYQLVSGKVKERRVASWKAHTEKHPQGFLYCFRGGMRSQITQQWLQEAGVIYPRVAGGYKAMRQFCVNAIERLSSESGLTLLAGQTGVGKTELLVKLDHHIDLEGLAKHRGSAFGRHFDEQPSVIDFENQLAITWLRMERQGVASVVMEDESRCIGRCGIPLPLWQRFARTDVVVLKDDLQGRAERIRREYIDQQLKELTQRETGDSMQMLQEHMQDALRRIQKRLGGDRFSSLNQQIEDAFVEQRKTGSSEQHQEWIAKLLSEYYDPMYNYQLKNKQERICFRGGFEEVLDYLSRPRALLQQALNETSL